MSKRKVSVEDKIYAVNLYLDGKESQRQIADMFDVSLASVQQWIRNYESMEANAFTLKGNKKYSKELKQQAVLWHDHQCRTSVPPDENSSITTHIHRYSNILITHFHYTIYYTIFSKNDDF